MFLFTGTAERGLLHGGGRPGPAGPGPGPGPGSATGPGPGPEKQEKKKGKKQKMEKAKTLPHKCFNINIILQTFSLSLSLLGKKLL